MSEFDELFRQAVKAAAKRKKKFTLVVGEVKAVNDNDTCTVGDYEDVRLNAIIDSLESKLTIYPVVGSQVVIARLEDEDDMFVTGFSEIDKVTIKIKDQLFEMKDGKFSIQSGGLSLKSILNDAFSTLQSATVMTSDGPASFSPANIQAFAACNSKLNELLL